MATGTPRDVDHEQLGGGDRLTVGSDAGRDAAEALRSLTKVSRASLLYDADNDAVARFLAELDITIDRALRHGPLELDVRPFELVRGDEVVYRERDREKSFAFRLYRDGIRRLEIRPEVRWDELIALVGVMSVRFTGVRQQEDDAVSLLWAARLDNIRAHTVHGYVRAEDRRRPGGGSARIADLVDAAAAAEPLPSLDAEAAPRFRRLRPAELDELRRETDDAGIADWCLRIAEHLADAVRDRHDPVSPEEVAPAAHDLSRVLVEEGHDRLLAEATETLAVDPAIVAAFTTPDLIERIVRDVLGGRLTHRALDPVLRHGSSAAVGAMLDRIDGRWRTVPETTRRPLLEKIIGERTDDIVELAPDLTTELRSDILTAIADRDPPAAVPLALDLLRRRGRETRLAAIAVVEQAPYSAELGRRLMELVAETDDATLRMRAAAILARHRERRAYDVVVGALERTVESGAGGRELRTLAQAAAILDPPAALRLFRGWVQPKGVFGRLRAAADHRWWPALWGLSRVPGGPAAETIRWMRDHTDGEFRAACEQALAARSGGGTPGDRR